jgi:hypothetical protein
MIKRITKVAILIILFSQACLGNELREITNSNELNYFSQTYYQKPKPHLIPSAINYIESSGLSENPNAKAPLLMSFSCIFSQHKDKEDWKEMISKLSEPSKELLSRSINESPNELLASMPTSPAKNDMNWACYFATGDIEYLNNIIHTLKYLEERQDMNLFLTAASAQWSLSANSKKHMEVMAAMMAMQVGDVISMRSIASDILEKDPQAIRDETVKILKAQKESGT